MNRFAALLDALLFTPGRLGKLRLIAEYLAATADPERGWALAALTGELSFAEAKPAQIRDLVLTRVDGELFGWSYDFVGDLAETASLIWPVRAVADRVPTLAEIVSALGRARRAETMQQLYQEYCAGVLPAGMDLSDLKIVIDCANGAAYKVGPRMLADLEAEIVPIGCSPNGRNINDGCGS
ncbi:MAG TPA: hypothetical protein VLX85_02455, partial [Stellaceae bacterium]|nr:hypothetical protein [Stellaceae bacterium]